MLECSCRWAWSAVSNAWWCQGLHRGSTRYLLRSVALTLLLSLRSADRGIGCINGGGRGGEVHVIGCLRCVWIVGH